MRFIVIGITDNPKPWFPPEGMEIIRLGKVFSGGRRHHEIVMPLLPHDAQWIDITVPLSMVFDEYRRLSPSGERGEGAIIVFASGDPLFFGFANTLQREFPDADIKVYPTFNSLQMLAHRLVMPYHDMRIVSLTGRPWPAFDRALIERTPKIGILTDREHTPSTIAQRMLEFGYNHYDMYVGEHLGNPELENITILTLEDAAQRNFSFPNCVIIWDKEQKIRGKRYGIPDNEFSLLDGRENMITKMPIRLLTLQELDLPHRHTLWDIGFCTGSISIEARLLFPHLHIEAFEIRPECEAIIQENMRRHGAPGINIHIGDFLETPLPLGEGSGERLPDAVFIGGHGGRLKEIMTKVVQHLTPDGIIVMNSVVAPKVTTDSHRLWDEVCAELGLKQDPPSRIQLNNYHPITILRCRR